MKQLFLLFLIFPLFGNNPKLYVNNTQELIDAFQKAKPGTVILLNDGTYDGKLVFDNKSGTRNNPITIKAASRGKAEVHTVFEITGDFIHIE